MRRKQTKCCPLEGQMCFLLLQSCFVLCWHRRDASVVSPRLTSGLYPWNNVIDGDYAAGVWTKKKTNNSTGGTTQKEKPLKAILFPDLYKPRRKRLFQNPNLVYKFESYSPLNGSDVMIQLNINDESPQLLRLSHWITCKSLLCHGGGGWGGGLHSFTVWISLFAVGRSFGNVTITVQYHRQEVLYSVRRPAMLRYNLLLKNKGS